MDHTQKLAQRYLKAALNPNRLDPSTRRRVNKAMQKVISGNEHYVKAQHGYVAAVEVLRDFDIELDDLIDSHVFNRDNSRARLHLAFTNLNDSFSPVPIKNAMLILAFYKRGEDDYEVTGYVS